MLEHGSAPIKCFLAYERTMLETMVIQHSALPDPKATLYPATEDIINIEFGFLDVESEIANVAAAPLAAERSKIQ